MRFVHLLAICRLRTLMSAGVAAALVATGSTTAREVHPTGPRQPASLYARLAALRPQRSIVPRTSIEVQYRPCIVSVTDSTIPGAECIPVDSVIPTRAGDELAADIARRLGQGPDPDAIHAGVLLRLLRGSESEQLEQSIDHLKSALPRARDRVAVMVDLSAAYLVLAGEEQSIYNAMRALEWAESAVKARPHSSPALFNRALALDALTCEYEALAAWQRYLENDRDPRWTAHGWARVAALSRRATAPMPGAGASSGALIAFATSNPQEALEAGWDVLLPEWGTAILSHDVATAADRLRRASILGDAVARRSGDRSLSDQVRFLHNAVLKRSRKVRELADSERLYGEARRAFNEPAYSRADSLLSELRARALPAPQALWTAVWYAGTKVELADRTQAERLLDSLRVPLERASYVSAAARRWWFVGTLLQRQGLPGDAPEAYREAQALYARARELGNRGRVQMLIADAEFSAGNTSAAYPWLQRAAATVRSMKPSTRRFYTLRTLSDAAYIEGLPNAARTLANEYVAVASAMNLATATAEARVSRGTLLAKVGDKQSGLRDLASGDSIARTMTDDATRKYFRATIGYGRGVAMMGNDLGAARKSLDDLLEFAPQTQEIWRTRGIILRARIGLAGGDLKGAARDLEDVFGALNRAREQRGGAARRDIEGEVRPALLQLVSILAAAGEARKALDYLERGSAALSAVRVRDARLRLPVKPGRVVVRPLVAGDQLLVWTITRNEVRLTRTLINPGALEATLQSLATALASRRDARAELSRLYPLLVGPVEARVGRDTSEIVFVNDGEFAGVPFAALLDGRGRPLVERHLVWTATTVAAASQAETVSEGDPPITFVAPTFDRARNRGLARLTAAADEVRRVARRGDTVIQGARADTAAVSMALARSSVLHFAGHAISNAQHPERSYLVVAPGAGSPDGRLIAASIEKLELDGVRLVVLAACTTLGSDAGSNGVTGLSGALLGAGAHGVIGSLWRVEDAPTRQLMTAFYRYYRTTGDPARALHQAQLDMFHAGRPPRAWAAFQYVGR